MKTEKNKEKKTDSFDWLVNGFMRGLLGRSDLKYVSVATQFRLLFYGDENWSRDKFDHF